MVQEPLDGFEVPAVHQAWPLPSYDLLEASVEGVISDDERRGKARVIEETLASFKVEAQVVGVNPGPAVTQFELQPAVGVKVGKITTLDATWRWRSRRTRSASRRRCPARPCRHRGAQSAISVVGCAM